MLLGIVFICGCGHPKVYKEVFKDKTSYNRRDFHVSREILRQAVLRIFCSRNFIVEKDDREEGFILAKRSFQKGKRNILLMVQAKMLSYNDEFNTLYLTAVQTTERAYVADRTRFLLFLIPLPGGGGKEVTTCKENEMTIKDKKFYQDFFTSIDQEASLIAEHLMEEQYALDLKVTTEGAYIGVSGQETLALNESAAKENGVDEPQVSDPLAVEQPETEAISAP